MKNTVRNHQFYSACTSGNTDQVKQFLADGIQINALIDEKSCPLHVSIKHPEVIKILVEAGIDPNLALGDEKQTTLHHAAVEGEWDSVRTLIALGADPLKRMSDTVSKPKTPFEMALQGGQMEVLESISNSPHLEERIQRRLEGVKKWLEFFPDTHGQNPRELIEAAYTQRNPNGNPLPFLTALLMGPARTYHDLEQEMLAFLASHYLIKDERSSSRFPLNAESHQSLMRLAMERGAVWTPEILNNLKHTNLEEWSVTLATHQRLVGNLETTEKPGIAKARM